VGQIALAHIYKELFARSGVTVAQILLTLEDSERRRRYLNARATLTELIELGALPVINENDTVATTEIRYGDNDRLAARVAQMTSSDCLLLLSDVSGLYTADPNLDSTARLIPEIRDITPEIEAMGGGSASAVGTGWYGHQDRGGEDCDRRRMRHGHRRRCATTPGAAPGRGCRVQLVPAGFESGECTQTMDRRIAASQRRHHHRRWRLAGVALRQEPAARRGHRCQRPLRARRHRERARSRWRRNRARYDRLQRPGRCAPHRQAQRGHRGIARISAVATR
jgi:hypothetical protein